MGRKKNKNSAGPEMDKAQMSMTENADRRDQAAETEAYVSADPEEKAETEASVPADQKEKTETEASVPADQKEKAETEASAFADPEEETEALSEEIGERDSGLDKIRRMIRQNKLALVSAIVIIAIILMGVLAPVIAPYGESQQDLLNRLQPPSLKHLFGTDELGRDVFSRILYGSRVSMLVGIVPSVISLFMGVLMGLLAGYFRGWVDYLIMRIADVMLSFPSLLLAMVIMYTLGSSIMNIFIALALVGWASVARVVRSQTLSLREMDYVDASRTIGVSKWKIMWRHIMPNCIPSLIVLFTLSVPSSILSESTLSFLGIGVQPPAASWGLMVNQSKQFLFSQPWLALAPSLSIMVVVLAFNFLGDGLRDVLDPHM